MPHVPRTFSITSGLSGSPALTISRNAFGRSPRGSKTKSRHTVGGAHNVFTPASRTTAISADGTKRRLSSATTVASAFHGAKKLDHACFAQPGELMFKWTSPGRHPIQYMVERCPTG